MAEHGGPFSPGWILVALALACSPPRESLRPPGEGGPDGIPTQPGPTPGQESTPGSGTSTTPGGTPDSPALPAQRLLGVNLAGADFGETVLPGTFGVNYTYPTEAEIDHFLSRGMNTIRLPFRWERLQRAFLGEFDAAEMGRLSKFVDSALQKGAYVLLDPHNYARYHGNVIDAADEVSALADFWSRLARAFPDERVLYGLMNEPFDMTTEQWLKDANAAITAIRKTGAKNLILVPGNAWTGAHSWTQNWYGTPNGTTMLGVVDPLEHYAYEVHQYLNGDSSGGDDSCVSRTIGSERIKEMTAWAKTHKKKVFLGEFSGGASETCLAALDDLLTAIDQDPDVWLGWTFWAAGPWWGNSTGVIEPINGVDRPQMIALRKHLPTP